MSIFSLLLNKISVDLVALFTAIPQKDWQKPTVFAALRFNELSQDKIDVCRYVTPRNFAATSINADSSYHRKFQIKYRKYYSTV